VHGSGTTSRVPVNALLFRAEGMQVAVVGADSRIHLHGIVPGRDFGRSIEVLSGVAADDDIVVNPPDSMFDGEEVRLAPTDASPVASPAAKKSG
jgi:hypothetical protein